MDGAPRNPTGRFTGLAGLYAQSRPSYPTEAVDFIFATCGLGPGSLLIDVGCGTGISSRLFAARGLRVIGIEPNADMRARASAEGGPAVEYRDGRAESTELASGTADAVLAAQAFHWFEPGAALREFHRILRPDGWVALIWNARDRDDPLTRAYSDIVDRLPDAKRSDGVDFDADDFTGEGLFRNPRTKRFPNAQVLDEEGLVVRALSASYAPREEAARDAYETEMRHLFRSFARGGQVTLRYQTLVYCAQRSE